MFRSWLSSNRTWLPDLLNRLTSFLLLFAVLTLCVYIAGNVQGFDDRTLVFLLAVESWVLPLGALLGVLATVANGVFLLMKQNVQVRSIVFSGVSALLAMLMSFVVEVIRSSMEGVL